jgi:cyclopropane-fatty-acyl-phospholipid synthase
VENRSAAIIGGRRATQGEIVTVNLQDDRADRARGQDLIEKLFLKADIRINGDRPFDIKVVNNAFFERVVRDGQLGIGESYMDGWWECEAIDEMTSRFIRYDLHKNSYKNLRLILYYLKIVLSGIGRKSKAFQVGRKHYDLGNDLFRIMLDRRMVYSCAYWEDAAALDQAQENKLDLVCRKVGLEPGMRVLDIGCGWGGWAKFAAQKYGVEVVGITVSKEQQQYAQESCRGLPIEIRLQDYRDVHEKFDRVVSIAMFEAVGHRYYRTFMQAVDGCLKHNGLFCLHTIVGQTHMGPTEARWLNEYIFPNGELPSLSQIMKSVERIFVVEAAHHFGADYEKTLEAWYNNFVNRWHEVRDLYDERFYRMWRFYLLISRGIFRSRLTHVWQFVFSKDGIPQRHVEKPLQPTSSI